MSKLYVLRNNPIRPETAFDTSFFSVEPVRRGDAPRCPTCGGPLGSLRWLPPYRVEMETWGETFGDIAFGPGSDLLVSERFAFLWEEAGLVGLDGFDPVEIVKVTRHARLKDDPPRYFRVEVVRSEAAIDDAASGLNRKAGPICPDCRIGGIIDRVRGIALEPSPAPVEDLFVARGLPGTILASERFRAFCARQNILNAVLIPASEYSFGR
jgi:hypothetical protein